jgi:hypothetical protein
MNIARAVPAFFAAADCAGEVLGDSAVGATWSEPSALARMTVGDLAGHLFLVVRRVDKHLDEGTRPSRSGRRVMTFPKVDRPDDLDRAVHAQVRHDGHHVATWGWPDVRNAYDARVAKLRRRLPGDAPPEILLADHAVEFCEYLASRVVELLVHMDDLAVSTGANPHYPPAGVMDAALGYLLDSARRVHGDQTVLRTFTRRERVPEGAPSIY